MPTFVRPVVDNEAILVAAVALPDPFPRNPVGFQVVADTGAQGSWISQRVVDAVAPPHIGISAYATIAQSGETDLYRVRLDIPVQLEPGGTLTSGSYLDGMDLDVSLMPYQPPNYDIILGMDFLCLFHITMVAGNFILSN